MLLLALLPCALSASFWTPRAGVIRGIQSSRDLGQRFASIPDVPFIPLTNTTRGTVLAVDTSQTFQSILGFGGAFTEAAGYNWQLLSVDQQKLIVQAYFGSPETSLGYTMCRVHMNSCDFSLASYSCDDVENDFELSKFNIDRDFLYLLPFIKAAQVESTAQNPLRMFYSPWSPPAWMKSNGKMTGSLVPGLKNDTRVHAAWAKFYSKFADAYRQQGVDFWGVTVQNEPLYAANWEACCYSIQDTADFVKNYLGPVLQKEQPKLQLMVYDHNRDLVQDWVKGIMSDPEVAKYVAGTAFHWYTGSNKPTLNMFENLDISHNAAPNKFLLASEACYCPGVILGDWSRGEAYGIDILNDILHWSTGWVDWNMVLDENGGPNHLGNMCDAPIIVTPGKNSFIKQPSYFFMGHFSKVLPPNSVRVGLSLSAHQVCRWSLQATDKQICDSITWACQNQKCAPGTNSCDPQVLHSNADVVFDQWFQSHKADGPAACDFDGAAVLEGVQVVSFVRPDKQVATVVLNVGDREAQYTILFANQQASSSIPGHSIQSLLWSQ